MSKIKKSNMNLKNKFKIKMLKKFKPIFLIFAQAIVEESISQLIKMKVF